MLVNCSVWGPVRRIAEKEATLFGGFPGLHAALMRVEGRPDKAHPCNAKDLKVWARLNSAAFKALGMANLSATWVVDGSKTARGAALRPARLMENGADVRFIKLIRSAGSVLCSVSKGTNRTLEKNKTARSGTMLSLQHQLRAYAGWIMANTAAEGITQKLGNRALDVRYENLVTKPNDQLARLTSWLDIAYLDGWENRMADTPRHMIGGNRNRFRPESVQRMVLSDKSDVIGNIGLGLGRGLAFLGGL